MRYPKFLLITLFLSQWTCQFSVSEPISFNKDVRPIFNEKCLSCHGGVKQMGGFSLLFEQDAYATTESGQPAIVKGNHKKSELYRRLIHEDEELRMPYEAPALTEREIQIIGQWIDEGAKWETHWAYVPPSPNINLPPVEANQWVRNGIDHFVWNKLAENGLSPNEQANQSVLVRRLYLDLIGLPPTLEEAETFFVDKDEQALENLVDQLLASPHFGEHWAAMWLDLARYGDSQGYQKDNIRWNIWRYRDWVINAFNEDLPFDQFTIHQLAGDLLDNPTDAQLLATAFHRNTNTNSEGGTDDEEFRTYAVMDRLATTYEIWQGMTISCVQCHSHPYDPILHEEYYQGLAYFNNTLDADRDDDFPRKNLLSPAEQAKLKKYEAAIRRAREQADTLSEEYVQLVAQKMELQPAGVPIMAELPKDSSRTTHIFERGNWLVKGPKVEPNVPQILPPITNAHKHNRLGLAQWLVDGKNPLTARVIVNRFWERIFGKGLVETVEDFGTQGTKPVHPALLDWLAVRFVETHQWSVKALLKDIVLSATYQQASTVSPEKLEKDNNNQLFSRGARFRLSAEQVRDQALVASGLFSPKVYGPSVMPHLPDGVYSVIRHIHRWETSENGDNYRRAIYTFWRKTSPYPSLISFDVPSREFCVSRRVRTNTPLQAMITLNDPVYLEAAQALAEKMVAFQAVEGSTELDPIKAKISFGFKQLLFKSPSAAQLETLLSFYQRTMAEYQENPSQSAQLVSHQKEGTAELAAMVNVANVLMNMDEFLMKG